MIGCVVKIKVSNDWLTHLGFSPWSLVECGRCEELRFNPIFSRLDFLDV